jgi:hypothetical protein
MIRQQLCGATDRLRALLAPARTSFKYAGDLRQVANEESSTSLHARRSDKKTRIALVDHHGDGQRGWPVRFNALP